MTDVTGAVGAPVPASGAAAFDGQARDGEVPRWRRGWVRFRLAPSGAALRLVTQCVIILALVVPLFALAMFLYRPHLRSIPALIGFFVVLAGVTVWNLRELKAQREARYEWFNPIWSVTATSAVIVEYGLFGLAVGIHGGVLLLMPCAAFMVAVLLGNVGMISVAWTVLVAVVGVEAGLQVPAPAAFWLTVLYAGTAAITAVMLHIALQGTLYGFGRNQSLAVLASYAGTLRHWPEDLEPIAGRLADALDIDRYAILTRGDGAYTDVLSWPRAGWPDSEELGDLAERATEAGVPVGEGDLVAAPASASGVDVVLVAPAISVLHVPVDTGLLDTGAALLAAMCGRAELITGLVDLANTDELTGIANRRHLYRALDEELRRDQRSGRTCAVAILDLDHFKEYNDRSGHVAGDRLLQRFCALVGQRIRAQDLLARYGGEEFCVLLPETDAHGAAVLVDDIRRWMTSDGGVGGITFSAGVAAWDGAESVDSLIMRADRHLYVAKSTGRNRVVASAA